MKLTLDANPAVTLVRSYANGKLRVGDRVFHKSCILTPEAVLPDWRPTHIDAIEERDLEALFASKPELVLLGTGERQRFPSVQIRGAFIRAGVGLEAMDLGAACRTFNVLVQEERRVCAALIFGESGGS